jgi:hypothetical protein
MFDTPSVRRKSKTDAFAAMRMHRSLGAPESRMRGAFS